MMKSVSVTTPASYGPAPDKFGLLAPKEDEGLIKATPVAGAFITFLRGRFSGMNRMSAVAVSPSCRKV